MFTTSLSGILISDLGDMYEALHDEDENSLWDRNKEGDENEGEDEDKNKDEDKEDEDKEANKDEVIDPNEQPNQDERHKRIRKLKKLAEKREATGDVTAGFNRKEKKTKLEKSLEILNKGFKEVAEKEAERYIKLEEMRHKQDLEYQLKLREMENERRREERQHELAIFQILTQQTQQTVITPPSMPLVRRPFVNQVWQGLDSMSVSGSSISDGENSFYQQL